MSVMYSTPKKDIMGNPTMKYRHLSTRYTQINAKVETKKEVLGARIWEKHCAKCNNQ